MRSSLATSFATSLVASDLLYLAPLAAKGADAAGGTAGTYGRMFVMLLVLLLVFAVAIGALALIRRRLHGEAFSSHQPKDFTLSDLRALHRDGQLSDEEFERAKARLVNGVQSSLRKEKQPTRAEEPIGEELK